MSEKRKYPRFDLRVKARYRIMSSKEIFKLGMTRNLSAEGISFDSQEMLDPGTYVELEIDLEDKKEPIALVGEIRWSSKLKKPNRSKNQFVNGVKLVEIPKVDETRFLKYYCDRVVEKLSGYLKM